MTRIILIDESRTLRYSTLNILGELEDLNIVGESANIREAIHLVHKNSPNVVLLGLKSREINSQILKLVSYLNEKCEGLKVLIWISSDKDLSIDSIYELFIHGAEGFILKEDKIESLIFGIRAAVNNQIFLSRKILENLLENKNESDLSCLTEVNLTSQEQAVLKKLALGMKNSCISQELVLSNQTVRNYLTRIYEKLDVRSRNEAIVWARENGFHKKQ
jgi:DNA-binding NarL/FixJ family response regulator